MTEDEQMGDATLNYAHARVAMSRSGLGISSIILFSIWGALAIASAFALHFDKTPPPGLPGIIEILTMIVASWVLLPIGLLLGVCGLFQQRRRKGSAIAGIGLNSGGLAICALMVMLKLLGIGPF